MIKKSICTLTAIITAVSLYGAEKKTVAVMNFKGYGDKSIRFLDNALPESVSTSLSEIKDIAVVERSQLGKILNEIVLEQTGIIDTGNVSQTGKLAKADILIIGTISGTQDNVIVTFKAVDVRTGTVIDSKTIKAPVSQIFNRTDQAARTMGTIISGKETGKLSVYSNPEGADVYLDDMQTGQTPLVGHSITKGKHSIKILKEGYLEHGDTLTIDSAAENKVSIVLARSQVRDRTEFGVGIHYLQSAYSGISPAPLYTVFMGHTFDQLLATIELGAAFPEHDLELTNPIGGKFTQKRWYDLYTAHVSASYVPFPQWKYILPYGGLTAGVIYAIDYRKNTGKEENKELLYKHANLSLGGKLGVNLLPYSSFSLFFEARYYYQPQRMTRYTYQSNGIAGDLTRNSEKINFNFMSIGGGAKLFF